MGQPRYMSYLLRLWQVEENEGLAWRLSLESPHTGKQRGFATLAALYSFLESQCANPCPDLHSEPEKEQVFARTASTFRPALERVLTQEKGQ
jgi:hypothetical protein